MSASIYRFPYRYSNMCPLGFETGCDVCLLRFESAEEEEDIAEYILSFVRQLDKEYGHKQPLKDRLNELLASKYGVQFVYELDEDALREFETEATLLKERYVPTASPYNKFRELLAYKYGVQGVYELDQEGLCELMADVQRLKEEMDNIHKCPKVLMFKPKS